MAFRVERGAMSHLTLKYQHDASFFDPKLPRDDFGRISVSVATERVSGRGGFWVQWQDVSEFGEQLAAYPISQVAPVTAQWGYEMQEGEDLILRVEIAPANKTGDLLVRVEIADDLHDQGPRDRVRASFLTNYPQLESFRSDITKLMVGEVSEAVLTGR
jgi:hypothetical protein